MNIISLKRAAVKLGIVSCGVYTVAAVGQLQLVAALLALNLLCGLYFKKVRK